MVSNEKSSTTILDLFELYNFNIESVSIRNHFENWKSEFKIRELVSISASQDQQQPKEDEAAPDGCLLIEARPKRLARPSMHISGLEWKR